MCSAPLFLLASDCPLPVASIIHSFEVYLMTKEKAPFELTTQTVSLYMLYDHARKVYINPLPIDTKDHAIELLGQLFETPGTYAYKGYKRFDLYRLCKYALKDGKVSQKDHRPTLICKGTKFLPKESK